MKFKAIIVLLLLTISSSAFAKGQPIRFSCGNNNFIVYFNASSTKVAVVLNDSLAENPVVQQQPYGDDMNATVLGFDVWGENGGLHDHYTTVFFSDRKTIKQMVQILDADNRFRGDAKFIQCH